MKMSDSKVGIFSRNSNFPPNMIERPSTVLISSQTKIKPQFDRIQSAIKTKVSGGGGFFNSSTASNMRVEYHLTSKKGVKNYKSNQDRPSSTVIRLSEFGRKCRPIIKKYPETDTAYTHRTKKANDTRLSFTRSSEPLIRI